MPAWLAVLFALAAVLVLTERPARAATLQSIQGVALVDRGSGFGIVDGPTQLGPGDSVIVNPGGSAQVVYEDGCKVEVHPGIIVSARNTSPCSGGGEAGEAAQADGGGFSSTTLLVAGAVVGVGAVTAVLLTASDSEKPASP